MANSQITAYVSGQLDKGVSREAITQALLGAGWMQADVDAAVNEVMASRGGAAGPAAAATPVTATAQPTMTAATQPMAGASPASAGMSSPASSSVSQSSTVTPASFFATTPSATSFEAAPAEQPHRSLTWLFIVVGVLLAAGIIGGIAYAFLGGSDAADLNAVAPGEDLATVQQERDQLKAEVTTLSDNAAQLESEIAIFAPLATPTSTAEVTVKGTLASTTAGAWTLTTKHNIVLTVSNAKDAGVAAAFAPLQGAEVELTGTHTSGSTLLKVTAVNGSAIVAPAAPAATSTTP